MLFGSSPLDAREVVSLLHELIAVRDGKIVDGKHRSVPHARVNAT